MKYTTIKGTTIAGDVPCETDGWVRKSDLIKIVEELEDKAHSAWGGKAHDAYQDAADMVESLLGGV